MVGENKKVESDLIEKVLQTREESSTNIGIEFLEEKNQDKE